MSNLHDILETCLQAMENGADFETVLARYPEQAEELRPILQASINAKKMAVPEPSADVVRRNRAKLLQHAAQMREDRDQPVKRNWNLFQNRLAITFFLFIIFLYGGTGIVSASSDAIPGDVLYPVKRGWEGVSLSFTFDVDDRDALASEQENERLREIDELFALGMSANVDFAGVVTSQRNDAWQIAQITVVVTPQTQLPDGSVHVGLAVRVYGYTRSDGVVVADRIEYLPVNSALPGIVPIFEETTATPTLTSARTDSGFVTETPIPTFTLTPSSTIAPTIATTKSNPGNVNSNSNNNDNPNTNDNDNDNDNNTNDADDNSNNDNSNDDNGNNSND